MDIRCPSEYNIIYMRKVPFVTDEIYHLYNRGTDKRSIVLDRKDKERFIESVIKFNTSEPIGSIYENSFQNKSRKKLGHRMSKLKTKPVPLVEFIAFSLNINHYHFQVRQLVDGGIEKFMQKFGNGYTKYFNNKYKRSGVLFQGKFKSIYVDSDRYLIHLNIYINFNNQFSGEKSSLTVSSLDGYIGGESVIPCEKNLIMDHFKGIKDYKNFAQSAFQVIEKQKCMQKELENEGRIDVEDNPKNLKTWTSDVQEMVKNIKKR